MITCPAAEEIALTVTSRQTVSQLITKSSSDMLPASSCFTCSATPKAAVTYADATFAGVAVKFVNT